MTIVKEMTLILAMSNIGRVYCIKNKQNNDIYVGSTRLTLEKRFEQHIRDLDRKDRSNGMKLYNLMDKLGKDNFYIEVIEEFDIVEKSALRMKEGEWIKKIGTLNIKVDGRTQKEYYNDNKEHLNRQHKEWLNNNKDRVKQYAKEYKEKNQDKIRQQQKEYKEKNKERIMAQKVVYRENNIDKIRESERKYREENKERIKEQQGEKVQCECGLYVLKRQLNRHKSCRLHKNHMQKLEIN